MKTEEYLLQDVKEVWDLLVNGSVPVGHQYIWKHATKENILHNRRFLEWVRSFVLTTEQTEKELNKLCNQHMHKYPFVRTDRKYV